MTRTVTQNQRGDNHLARTPEQQLLCPVHNIAREASKHTAPRYQGCTARRGDSRHVSETHCCLLVGCSTSQQHASIPAGRVCLESFTCCHSETEVADQTFCPTQSQYTDTGPNSPSAGPITRGAWKLSHWIANFEVTGMSRPRTIFTEKAGMEAGSATLEADVLTTRARMHHKVVRHYFQSYH